MNEIGLLVQRLLDETTKTSVGLFVPELVLSGTIVAMLLCRILPLLWRVPAQWIALLGAFTAFAWTLCQFDQLVGGTLHATDIFTGLLRFDQFATFFRMFLCLFLILTITLTVLSAPKP